MLEDKRTTDGLKLRMAWAAYKWERKNYGAELLFDRKPFDVKCVKDTNGSGSQNSHGTQNIFHTNKCIQNSSIDVGKILQFGHIEVFCWM